LDKLSVRVVNLGENIEHRAPHGGVDGEVHGTGGVEAEPVVVVGLLDHAAVVDHAVGVDRDGRSTAGGPAVIIGAVAKAVL
jgi:hypothetical protein